MEPTHPNNMTTEMRAPNVSDLSKRNSMSESEVAKTIEAIKKGMEPESKRIPVTEDGLIRHYAVERRGVGPLNTKYGKFWEFEFAVDDNWETYSVIVKADIDRDSLTPQFKDKNNLTLRIDSGCKTGQMFGDLTCECGDQLDLAMKTIAEKGEGLIVNIPKQDGRGMGISFKLATLWLQDELGVNTVESASILAPGGVIDVRTYSGVIGILKFFEIPESAVINLASNNPKKASIFEENGYKLGDFVPIVIEPTEFTEKHLRAKQEHLGHINLVE